MREPPIIGGRVPPNDLDAEAIVLGAMFLNPEARDVAFDVLEGNDFYSDNHRLIFDAMVGIDQAGGTVDVLAVAGWLRDRQTIERAGGAKYLGDLTTWTPASGNVAAHARRVRSKSRLRKLIQLCQSRAANGYDTVEDVDAYIAETEREVANISFCAAATDPESCGPILTRVMHSVAAAAERGDGISGQPTHYTDLDKKTAGLHPGDLLIVAARPGMGKTAFALGLALNVATTVDPRGGVEPKGAAVFSLEMPKEQVAGRLVCAAAHVDVGAFRAGYLRADDWGRLTESAGQIAQAPIVIDDTPGLSVRALATKVRRLKAEWARLPVPVKLSLVVVDYLQLMTGDKSTGSREQEISSISRDLKALAKDLGVPVVALSQLNRSVETRSKDKRPMLSDLRESGAIEQDADTIVFIYRDDYYHPDSRDRGISEVIIAKQRNGPTGTVRMRWTSSCTRFDNLAGFDNILGGDEFEDFHERADR